MLPDGPEFAAKADDAIPLVALSPAALEKWMAEATDAERSWCEAHGFSGDIGETLILPGENGSIRAALVGLGSDKARKRGRFALADGAGKLPVHTYELMTTLTGDVLLHECLGLLLSGYAFDRYKPKSNRSGPHFIAPAGTDERMLTAIAAGEFLTRDLINIPAEDMGPDALETTARALADECGASIDVIEGAALLAQGFPLVHTVGRAAERAPRLIDMRWGTSGPKLTLVGKGVCFDTGGLNLKPGASMALMKKDMGGAATVLGLARMITRLGLPVQLRVLIPAVENAVAGASFRPGDILTSRKGLTVEINNTDAEGRLVLADALALAAEDTPDLTISMATLTGAARVAVGPDLAPFFAELDDDATTLAEAGSAAADPVWRLPFWDPYEKMIEPGIADLDNAPSGGFAGSITAALFLRRFAPERYIHFDIYGWQPTAAPARPKGGVGQGARAILAALPHLLDLE